MKWISLLFFCITGLGSLQSQNVGIGVSAPLATLDVARGSAGSGTALFRGTEFASSFNYGTSEDTYIRGGKPFSHVIINDMFTLGNVGIGTAAPLYKLHVAALGAGIVQSDGIHSVGTYTGSGGGWLGTFTNHPLYFFTNNGGQLMTIHTNGNIGMGTPSPQTKLHINKNDEALRISGTNSYMTFYNNNDVAKSYIANSSDNLVMGTFGNTGEVSLRIDGQLGLVVQSDTRVRVGNLGCDLAVGSFISQYPKFSVHGPLGLKKSWGDQLGEWTLYYTVENLGTGENQSDILGFYYNGAPKAGIDDGDGTYYSVSDRRLKEEFENYKDVLPGILKLDILTYHYKSNKPGRRSFGLVAQNLRDHFPELIMGDDTLEGSTMSIAYGKTGVLAIKAIQEQQVIIEAQQKTIEDLAERLAALESKLK